MASMNLFEVLGGDDAEDPDQLVLMKALHQPPTATHPKPAVKMPTRPLPPSQAVKEARNDTGRGGGRGGRGYGGGRGRGGGGFNRDSGNTENAYGGRGGGGFNRDSGNTENAYGGRGGGGFNRDSGNTENVYGNNGFSGGYRPSEDGEGKSFERRGGYGGPRGGGVFRGGRRGNSEGGEGERQRRTFERHSGTGRGHELKREGAGRRNWGTPDDEIVSEGAEGVIEIEKNVVVEKQLGEEEVTDIKEAPATESEEKEPEEKEMTLEEYEKVLEEKRKALLALKSEERKVNVDKEFESMQQLSNKKTGDEIFIKLGSEKDKRKEASDKEEKAKKSVSITEFLKPADGERYYGGRDRGRGRGGARGGYRHGGPDASSARAPAIQDLEMFPSLGGGK